MIGAHREFPSLASDQAGGGHGIGRSLTAIGVPSPVEVGFAQKGTLMEFGRGPYSGSTTPASEFPSVLPFNEATDYLAETPTGSVFLGVDGTGEPVRINLEQDSPHVLVNASTGGGKSSIARAVAVQRLMVGDMVVFLDVKRHSHRWAKGLAPLVHYAPDVTSVGDALVNLGREVHRRNQIVDEWDGPLDEAPVGPPILVVFEEMNATTARLKELDRQDKSGGYRAMDALGDIGFMGRAVKVRLISFAVMATYRASGGSEMIECYGTRIMVNYSPKAWRYLAEDCGRPVPAPPEVGRGMVCRGTKATEVQFLWIEEEGAEARDAVLASPAAQKRVRELLPSRSSRPPVWRTAIGR